MSIQSQTPLKQLRDKMNYTDVIQNQLLTFQQALLKTGDDKESQREVEEAIKGLIHLVPDSWKDDQFKKDYAKAVEEIDEDVRPVYGGVRLSNETCETLGLPTTKRTSRIDWYKAFQCCINLLDRRGLLSKTQWIEQLEELLEDESTETDLQ
ncbi:MAG: hypothetical protein ACUVT9_05470 [Candidatus Bathycorpusculaceae bacterium]